MKQFWRVLTVLFFMVHLGAQQRADEGFRFDNPQPAFESDNGPVICIDEAHQNFHTAEGRYRPFADLLRGDGYRVVGFDSSLSEEALGGCAVLVSANPIGPANEDNWAYPHDTAFEREELVALVEWVRAGGALLLFIDHAPMPGAAADLGLLLGVAMMDNYARADRNRPVPDVFTRQAGTLRNHAIVNGRNTSERVDSLATFTGQAFYPSWQFRSILVYPRGAEAWTDFGSTLPDIPEDEEPIFPVAGWSLGAVRSWGDGRVVVLGEAALCTAQTTGGGGRMGMSHPEAGQNAQFCLNTVRWLTGVLD